jgi:hypothetical protein
LVKVEQTDFYTLRLKGFPYDPVGGKLLLDRDNIFTSSPIDPMRSDG